MATDLLGVSGRAMLDALVAGTTDPDVLAELARGRLRAKLPALREALRRAALPPSTPCSSARSSPTSTTSTRRSAALSDAIEEQLAPFAPAVELLCTIPGVQRRTAEVIIAETGGDMTTFATASHLASWAGMCPGNDESAGKRRSGKTRKGSRWLRIALVEARQGRRPHPRHLPAPPNITGSEPAAARNTRHDRRRPLDPHRGLAHALQRRDLPRPRRDFFARRDPERSTRRLVAQLERLGHTVTLEKVAA